MKVLRFSVTSTVFAASLLVDLFAPRVILAQEDVHIDVGMPQGRSTPASSNSQRTDFYVYSHGTLTPVKNGDMAKYSAAEWQAWYFKTGSPVPGNPNPRDGVWGGDSAKTAQSLMEKVKKSQNFELAFNDWAGKGRVHDDPDSTFNVLAPIAVLDKDLTTRAVQGTERNFGLGFGNDDVFAALDKLTLPLPDLQLKITDLNTIIRDSSKILQPPTQGNPYSAVGGVLKEYTKTLREIYKLNMKLRGVLNRNSDSALIRLTHNIGQLNSLNSSLLSSLDNLSQHASQTNASSPEAARQLLQQRLSHPFIYARYVENAPGVDQGKYLANYYAAGVFLDMTAFYAENHYLVDIGEQPPAFNKAIESSILFHTIVPDSVIVAGIDELVGERQDFMKPTMVYCLTWDYVWDKDGLKGEENYLAIPAQDRNEAQNLADALNQLVKNARLGDNTATAQTNVSNDVGTRVAALKVSLRALSSAIAPAQNAVSGALKQSSQARVNAPDANTYRGENNQPPQVSQPPSARIATRKIPQAQTFAIQDRLDKLEEKKDYDQIDVELRNLDRSNLDTSYFAFDRLHLTGNLVEQKRYSEAEYHYKILVQQSPGGGYDWRLGRWVYQPQQRYAEAIEQYQSALKNNIGIIDGREPGLKTDIELWIQECHEQYSPDPEQADKLSHQAYDFWTAGKLEGAERAYREAVRLDRYRADYHRYLGSVLGYEKKFAEAEEQLREAIRLEPTNGFYEDALGDIFVRQEKWDQAEEHYRQALHLNPTSATIHYDLGQMFARQKRYEAAIGYYQEATRLNPKYADAYVAWAEGLNSLGKKEDAKQKAEKALQLGADKSAWIFVEVGLVLSPSEAAIPPAIRPLIKQGEKLMAAQKWVEAEAILRDAIRLNPQENYADVYYDLGDVLCQQNKWREAIPYYQKSLQIHDTTKVTTGYPVEFTYANLAGALYVTGNLDEAKQNAEKAIQLGCKTHWVYQKLGLTP